MFLIDTNIHAAYLLQIVENDELTKKYLAAYAEITLTYRIVPDFILAEFETFIIRVIPPRYKLSLNDKEKLEELALDYIDELVSECTLIAPEIKIVQNARKIFFEYFHNKYISFTDSLLLATAQEKGYTVFTKDRKINDIAKERNISFYSPSDL